ncbi:Rpr2-domain-containing protein [Gigaspora margarita]|uniref:Rpr2-domain-containing protein n=1 Tax=Gigaspora margarita TaxID=4874 RepID=A0A8H3XJM1_GIGMA|nr:Rpr2-domain-containing protein [Gigaspora margarita]
MGKKTEPGQVLHRELYQRMDFLYQAATLMTTITSTNTKKSLIPLSRFHISTMKSIGTKQVLRIDPSIKRTLCKRYDSVLLPGVISQIRIKSKPEPQLQMMCTQCGTAHGYPIRKGYQLFSEKQRIFMAQKMIKIYQRINRSNLISF